jgi:asparagine synthase (glutamine-hydrolysing)
MALKMFFGYKLNETEDPLYSHLLRWHNTSRIKSFFLDDYFSSLNGNNPLNDINNNLPNNFGNWSGLSKSQFLEANIFMSGYLLSSQGDRMAMGNSVEGRYPFLDYRVIEFCNQMPDNYKLNCLNEKFILKKLSEGKIPDSITSRSKQAYRAPIISSLFSKNAPDYLSDILSEKSLNDSGIFNPEKVKSLLTKIKNGGLISEIDQMAITGILSTQILNKKFIQEPIIANKENLKNYRIIDQLTIL